MVYVFKNSETGEIRRSESFAMHPAARRVGIAVPYRGKLPAPWLPWECWDRGAPIWHYTEAGDCVDGPRP